MPTIEESIVIPVPPRHVYDYLLDPSHLPEFSGSILFTERIGNWPKGDDQAEGDIGNWPKGDAQAERDIGNWPKGDAQAERDIGNWPKGDDQAEGDIGNWPIVGSRLKGATKVLGRRVDWVAEYTELDRPNKQSIRSVEGRIEFTAAYIMAPEGEGTHLTYRLETAAGLGGVFGKLADALVNKAYERQVRADLATLAEILTEHQGH